MNRHFPSDWTLTFQLPLSVILLVMRFQTSLHHHPIPYPSHPNLFCPNPCNQKARGRNTYSIVNCIFKSFYSGEVGHFVEHYLFTCLLFHPLQILQNYRFGLNWVNDPRCLGSHHLKRYQVSCISTNIIATHLPPREECRSPESSHGWYSDLLKGRNLRVQIHTNCYLVDPHKDDRSKFLFTTASDTFTANITFTALLAHWSWARA